MNTRAKDATSGFSFHFITGLITRWVLFVADHARVVLAVLLVLTLLAAFFAVKLFSLNSDTSQLIKPSVQRHWHQQDEAFNAAFPQFQNTAIVVVSGNKLAQVNTTTDALVAAFRQSDWFYSVAAPGREPFFIEHLLYELETDQLADFSEQLQALLPLLQSLDDGGGLASFFALLQQSLVGDGLRGEISTATESLLQKLSAGLSGSGAVNWFDDDSSQPTTIYQVVILQGRQQFGESTPAKALMEKIRSITEQHKPASGDLRIRVTGEIAMADEELQTALQGIQFAGIAALVLLALLLTFGVRSWTIVLAIFTLLLAGVVWTCVYAALTVGSFNTLSLVFLVMFFGLGVDFAIHFCLRVQEALSSRSEKQQALRSAIEDVGTALLLCTITSAIAFLSFLPTEYSGLAELGIISAGGIAIAFILTVTLLPAWFTAVAMPAPWHRDTGSRSHFGIDQYKPSTVLLLTALISCAAAWYARDVHFDYSVLAMRDKTSEAMATLLELQNEQVSTDYSVSVLVEPNAVDALAQRLWALPSVAQVITPRSRIASEQLQKQALLAPLAAYGALHLQLPEHMDNAAVDTAQASLIDQLSVAAGFANAQALPLLSSVRAGLQALGSKAAREMLQANVLTPLFDDVLALKKQLLASPYSLDDLPPVSRARLIAPDGRHRLEVLPREQLNDLMLLNQFVAEVEAVAPNIAGRAVVERGVGQLVVESFRMATTLALVGIFIVLVLYFRELLTPVLVLIPLGLTTLFTFAVIELSGLTLNMANILVVPLIFGLGVDTGIHVVHRYHVSRNISELLRSSTPRAVTLSALTTIGTFISLSFNPHKGAASIGLILSVAISLLMLVTFVVLPALLAQFEKKSLYKTTPEDEPSG